jgi:pSer/pThr/pTyr-binding forkhead associated (FHA) protein
MRVQLVSLDDGRIVDLQREMTIVGRKPECDFFIDHKTVSKAHCVLVRADGLVFLRDLGSTNGTRVNGVRVRRATLLPTDKLQIASFEYRLNWLPDEPPHAKSSKGLEDSLQTGVVSKKGGDSDEDLSIPLDNAPLVRSNSLPDVIEK